MSEQIHKIAFIREAECIGCTKCIQACPFDAIVGAEKQMHTVLLDECVGCELCVAPCPVDCIEMRETPAPLYDKEKVKQRVLARKKRLQQINKLEQPEITNRQQYIQAAVERAKIKKFLSN
jgi:Na+-translocating ferredoxin:NAD+ oxidoreductase subunit B